MYLPEGKVMPAYSTWQPIDGMIQPIVSPAQTARRRWELELRNHRGVPVREEAMGSTLLEVELPAVGPNPRRPPVRESFLSTRGPATRSPVGAIVGFSSHVRDRPARPVGVNDSGGNTRTPRSLPPIGVG